MKQKQHKARKRLRKHAFTSLAYFIVALLTLTGSIIAWDYTKADEIINVSASVGGVVVGPTAPVAEESDDDEDDEDDSEDTIVAKPVVSIEPATLGSAEFSSVTDTGGKLVTQFTSARPSFQGYTNIKDALIRLEFSHMGFRLRSTTKADAAGKWQWRSPEAFPNGSIRVDVTAESSKTPNVRALTRLDLLMSSSEWTPAWTEIYKSSAREAFFEVTVEIPELFQSIAPGDELVAEILLTNLGNPGASTNAKVEYLIVNETGKTVSQSQETLSVVTELRFLKSFYTQSNLQEGKYELIVRVPSQDLLAIGSGTFMVEGDGIIPISPIGRIDYSVILQALLGMMALFTLLAYFEFMRFLALKKSMEMVTDTKLKIFL